MSTLKTKQETDSKTWLRLIFFGGAILLVAGGIVGLSLSMPKTEVATTRPANAATPTPDLSLTVGGPKPGQYDPVKDQYWHVTDGTGHWHPGKPPGLGKPWEYNKETNQHYDPRPGHEHWHTGPAPPPDQRQ